MTDKRPDLGSAYALKTPDDSRKLYADWAKTYDAGFAQDMDYQMPRLVALILAETYGGAGPVLDVGAGTGLVVQSLPTRGAMEIDALDISPEMLEVAAGKGLYRRCIEGDLTGRLEIADGSYDALVSAGTFTHGHVGPAALDELLRIARPGAQFVLAINSEHFETQGFAAKFEALTDRLTDLEHRRVNIYGAGTVADHKDDLAHVAVFRKR